jgi:exodeoxyribonuclease V alpha subunit
MAMKNLLKALSDNGDISPLSYFFACFIAEHSAADVDSLLAFSAALVSQNNQNGDVCVELGNYLGRPLFDSDRITADDLPCGIKLEPWRQSLLESAVVGTAGDETPLILDGNRLYLNRYWRYESRVAELISARLQPLPELRSDALRLQMHQLFPDHAKESGLNSQEIAVALAAMRNFVVISGGPGTGKTTTVIKILALLLSQQPDLRIKLAAPTGKAAARLMEAIQARKDDSVIDPSLKHLIPQQASTIHRLLGYGNNRYRHSASNPLALDCLVIDEASMLDLTLSYRIFDALPAQSRIILLGDRDQLASVAAGNVLGDITGHGQAIGYSQSQRRSLASVLDCAEQDIPHIESTRSITDSPIADSVALLTQSFRFSQDSDIGLLANMINQGNGVGAVELLKQSSSGLSWQASSEKSRQTSIPDWVLQSLVRVVKSETVSQALDEFNRTRILCAVHKGPYGIDAINRLITERLYPQRAFDSTDDYHAKPILITANDYEQNLFNGDTGLLWRDENGKLLACFRDENNNIRSYPIYSLPQHTTAWAMTIHKSQGSEFESVFVVLPDNEDSAVVTRELLYTGVTRAQHKLLIQSSEKVFIAACEKLTQRSSGLANKLGWDNIQEPVD